MTHTPAVTVVMPVHNAGHYLDTAIDSVLAQTFTDFELICFNDASTDNSLEILKRRTASDSRIRVIDSKTNVRQGAGRNAGIRAARGSFIIFLDSDDSLSSDAIALCMERAARGADLVTFCYSEWWPAKNIQNPINLLGSDAENLSGDDLRMRYLLRTSSICCSMYSKKLFTENNLWFPEGVHYEDNAIALALQLSAASPAYIHRFLYLYRQDNQSVTRSTNPPRFFDRIQSAVTLLSHLKRLGHYSRFKDEIDYVIINQYLVHTVYGAIYRFDSPRTDRIAEVARGISQLIPHWNANRYWRSQPTTKRLKLRFHIAMPRTIKALSNLKRRLL